jgi:hypothetical protein
MTAGGCNTLGILVCVRVMCAVVQAHEILLPIKTPRSFRKLDLFPSSGEGFGDTLLVPIERANLIRRTLCSVVFLR